MKKPKSKLDKAKERFVGEFMPPIYTDEELCLLKRFKRQLNNLIRLAKEEGRQGK
jgi:hypothetical protein